MTSITAQTGVPRSDLELKLSEFVARPRPDGLVDFFIDLGDFYRMHGTPARDVRDFCHAWIQPAQVDAAFGAKPFEGLIPHDIIDGEPLKSAADFAKILPPRDLIESLLIATNSWRKSRRLSESVLPNVVAFDELMSIFDLRLGDEIKRFHVGYGDLMSQMGDRAALNVSPGHPRWLRRILDAI